MSAELTKNQKDLADIKVQCMEFAIKIWPNYDGCQEKSIQTLAKDIFEWVISTENSFPKFNSENALQNFSNNKENCKS